MNPQTILILVGFFYILIAGGMSLLRREGLSIQFALESLGIILLAAVVAPAIGINIGPILLFVILYLVTMRARLLTDLANLLFKRRGYATAERIYRLALSSRPDYIGRYIVIINWGIARLLNGDTERAVVALEGVLALASDGNGPGPKYEAACRYNLALGYRKIGQDVESVRQFNQVIDLFPSSVYAQAAEKQLKKRRERGLSKEEDS